MVTASSLRRLCAAPRSSRASPTGPRCVVRGEVSPDAIARFDGGGVRRRRGRARGVRRGGRARSPTASPRKAGTALGRRRRGADRERRPGPRQGPARRGRASTCEAGERPARGRARGAVEQFVDDLHQHGRPDGRAGHRPARHRAPASSPTSSASPSRASDARRRRRSWSPRTSRRPTPPASTRRWSLALVTERGGPTSHTAIIARQLGIPCVVGAAGAMALAGRHLVLVDGDAGTIEHRPRPRRGRARGSRPTVAARAGAGHLDRPRRDRRRRRASRSWRTSPTASPRATPREAPVEGVGLFRTELCFLDRTRRAVRRGAGRDLRRGARAVRRRPVRRGPHPRRRLRQADGVRHATRARRTPPSASAGCGCRSTTPGCWTRQLDGDRRRRPRRPAPRPG